MVVGHGKHNSDTGGNGAPLRRRRKTVSTLTLRLGGEVEELQTTTMESRTSWSEKRGNGEVHGLGGAMARRRLFSVAPARARERNRGRG